MTSSSPLGADRLQCAELVQVLDHEGVEGLAGDRQADDEADHRHKQHVGAEAGLEHIEVGDLCDELVLGQRKVSGFGYAALDLGDIGGRFWLDQDVGNREARIRDVLQRAVVGRVQRRHAEQPAGCDRRDADDDAAVVVQFELRADRRIVQLVEFRVLDRNERVLGVDVLDLAVQQGRAAEQAGVVQPDDIGRLIRAVAQLQQRGAGIERHRILDARNAAHLVEHVVGQGNGIGNGLYCRVHDPHRTRRC